MSYDNVYVIRNELKDEFINYFSFVQEGAIYEDQCYGFKVSFSAFGNDTKPADFLECWLTDPEFSNDTCGTGLYTVYQVIKDIEIPMGGTGIYMIAEFRDMKYALEYAKSFNGDARVVAYTRDKYSDYSAIAKLDEEGNIEGFTDVIPF